MLEDPLFIITRNIYQFLISKDEDIRGMLVKKHSVNLQTQGDFSFPNTVKSWHEYINKSTDSGSKEFTLLNCIGKETTDVVISSRKWVIPVKDAQEIKDRIHLFLDRSSGIKVGLTSAIQNNNLISNKLSENTLHAFVDTLCAGSCINSLRLKCLKDVINHLLAINSTHLPQVSNIVLTSKSLTQKNYEGRVVLCGTVLNANTNVKETALNGEDFIRLRQNELTLIAQHKYGVRVATDSKWKEFISHLGESAVTFELLQTKPSCAVKINFDVSSGSSRGAAFILYNCARLETIIRTYNERVNGGTYPPLPEFEKTDFTLLTQEEEWCLIFNYILGLPSLLRNCVEINDHMCDFRPHLICGFLSSMVRLISQYYRKTRILTEPRKHLLPVMFARLHMLKILNETLKICLRILNIKSVSQM
ncbi:unnamed protein product [Parnassius apollo]|uniref:(apollo) hypothetical protein n=1 Tax=Parnassius apollo TaxID=110799 RepID=A0A8S3WQC5_PARAO|nr:unnamed protein product [Parnassius apollo]